MSKRNFILLVIGLVGISLLFFGFLYFQTRTPGEDGEGTNFVSEWNPFGNGNNTNPDGSTDLPVDVSGYEPPPESDNLELLRVSSMPVAGYSVFQKERLKEVLPPAPAEAPPAVSVKPLPPQTEFAPAVRYVDRAEGNVYQTFADKIEERRFSGTTIPKVYEAFFGNNGQAVIMRYLKSDAKTIQTFWGVLPKEILGGDSVGEMEIRGTYLPDNITDLALSPDTQSLFYLFNSGESAIGTTLNLVSGVRAQIFDSPFTEWLSLWPKSTMITLTTRPSGLVPGYMYRLDPGSKSFSQALDGVNGLTTLTSPDGKSVLVSDSALSLYVYDMDTKSIEPLGLRTLAEKCAWSRSGSLIYCSVPKSVSAASYPDSWYQGESSFEDQIWKIDLNSESATMIADLPEINEDGQIDGIKLSLDTGEKYLFFVNKKDSYLWELRLR